MTQKIQEIEMEQTTHTQNPPKDIINKKDLRLSINILLAIQKEAIDAIKHIDSIPSFRMFKKGDAIWRAKGLVDAWNICLDKITDCKQQ